MKFGKYIQSQLDWPASLYINYKALKQIINSLNASNVNTLKPAFFYRLERELEKVNAFYLQKESEFSLRLKNLVEKVKSPHLLKDALDHFQNDLSKLQRYVEVNNTGFAKILKKWDKRSTSSTREIYLSRQIDIQPCFNKEILTEMSDQINAMLQDISKKLNESASVLSEQSSSNDLSQVDTVIEKLFLSGNEASLSEFLTGFQKNPDAADVLSRAFMKLVNRGSTTSNLTPLILSGLLDYQTIDEVSGRSILHEAVIARKLDLIQQCLEHGADASQLDVFGRSPLHYAASMGFKDGLELLMKHTKVDLPDLDGQRPLLLAISAGHLDCVQVLLNNGADINQTQESYISPLALACRNGKSDIVTLLLKRGAALISDKESIQPIHIAAREGHTSILNLMVQSGANVNSIDTLNGWTPIMYAASEGHYDAVKLLIDRGCSIEIEDHSGWLPWTYALYKGHLKIASLLEIHDYAPKLLSSSAPTPLKPQGPSEFFKSASEMKDFDLDELSSQIDLDQIPSLSLPPPMIPFRIYGHNFLDKKTLIQITFTSGKPVKFFENRPISSMKLTVTCSEANQDLPRHISLPLKDEDERFHFLVEQLEGPSLVFDLRPAYGSNLIGRSVLLSGHLVRLGDSGEEVVQLPIMDDHSNLVGELTIKLTIVKPFLHPEIQIGGRVDTYWKSTQTVLDNKPNPQTFPKATFVTASSLAEEYLRISVQLTSDQVPIVHDAWTLDVHGLSIPISHLSSKQLSIFLGWNNPDYLAPLKALRKASGVSAADFHRLLCTMTVKLEDVLTILPASIGISIEIKYPSVIQRNLHDIRFVSKIDAHIDQILKIIYEEGLAHQIIFSSFSPSICARMNWKQPNHGVFFKTGCGYYTEDNGDMKCLSIQEAIRFSKRNNLLGIICEAKPLLQMPQLIHVIKESGLIVGSMGESNKNPVNLEKLEKWGVDVMVLTDRVHYKN